MFSLVCDPGVDDAVALAVLVGLGQPPGCVVAVAGNVDAGRAARNAAGAAALLGLDVPVLQGPPGAARTGGRHGPDGFVGLGDRLPSGRPPAPLVRLDGDLLVTAPLTAVAATPARRGEVLWQGGGFNATDDPAAAAAVRARVVPVEVSGQVAVGAGGPALLEEAMTRFGPTVHDAVAAVAWCRPDRFRWRAGRAVAVDAASVAADVAGALLAVRG